MQTIVAKKIGAGILTVASTYIFKETKESNVFQKRIKIYKAALEEKKEFSLRVAKTLCPLVDYKKPSTQKEIDSIFLSLEDGLLKSKDLSQELFCLQKALEKNTSIEFIEEILERFNVLLDKFRYTPPFLDKLTREIFFKTVDFSKAFSECDNENLTQLQIFFPLFDELIKKTDNKSLQEKTKITFANLPYEGSRQDFKHLFLDEKEQIACILTKLEKQENAFVNEIIKKLDQTPCFLSPKEETILQKLVFRKEEKGTTGLKAILSDDNKKKLEKALTNRKKRSDGFLQNIIDALLSFKENPTESFPLKIEGTVKFLQRTAKCKFFFKSKTQQSHESIKIPFWYHATNKQSISYIINNQKIDVSHRQAYEGAWVSSLVESYLFGNFVIGLTNNIEASDEKITIARTFSNRRWRGFLSPIELKKNMIFCSVSTISDKELQKKNKSSLKRTLKAAEIENVKIISEKQISFMQEMITSTIGHPNLSKPFWSHTESKPLCETIKRYPKK